MAPKVTPAMERYIIERIAVAIAEHDANRASGSGTNRNEVAPEPVGRVCTYKDFLSCKPTNFKGTEGAVGLLRWFEKMETVFRISSCLDNSKVKFATCTLLDSALTWWNSQAQTLGLDAAYEMSWENLKRMMTEKYCPRNEIQKLEAEFWDLKVENNDVEKYTDRFHELSTLCPTFVTSENRKVERYIWGLSPNIQGLVTASEPNTIQGAVSMACKLMDQVKRRESTETKTHDVKRKAQGLEDITYAVPINSYPPINQLSNQRTYEGNNPRCITCQYHHYPSAPCRQCTTCKRYGHLSTNCRSNPQTKRPRNNNQLDVAPHRSNGLACFMCGDPNHFRKNCPKLNNINAIEGPADDNED